MTKKGDGSQIWWLKVVCKLTNSSDALLYRHTTMIIGGVSVSMYTPAVFTTVKEGFETAASTEKLYRKSGSAYVVYSGAVKLKMLQDYTLDEEEHIEYNTDAARDITFTTAEGDISATMTRNGDSYTFTATFTEEDGRLPTDSKSTAIIRRETGFTDASMITKANSGAFTVENIILDGRNVSAAVNGGIISANAGSLKIQTGAVLRNSKTTQNGGAVYVDNGATVEMTGGEITGNAAANGGAVYVVSGGTVTLKDGTKPAGATEAPHATINGNTATTAGAGIYLAEGAKLNLEGSPNFGGTGTADSTGKDPTAAISGPTPAEGVSTNGNYVTGDLASKTNGQKPYTKARQDIYLNGYESVDAASIVVTGKINSAPGSIWVWADTDLHAKMLNQFAMLSVELLNSGKTAIDIAKITQAELDATYLVFRNAQDDVTTECGGDYLTGQEGDSINLIKWTGGFDFVFKKIDGEGNALDGAEFTLYMAVEASKGSGDYVPAKKDSDGKLIPATSADGSDWVAYQQSDKTSTSGGKKDVKRTSGEILDSAPVTIKVKQTDDSTTPPTDKVVDREVSGDGLVVFEKIPPGVYFIKETTPLTVTVGSKTTTYIPVEDMYMVDLNGKGYYSITKVEVDKTANTYTNKGAASTETLSFGTGEDAYTVDVALAINVDARTRKVILKKVDGTNTPLKDKYFTVKYADKQTVVKVDGVPLEKLKSGVGGAFWIGKLPFGTYYMEEFDSDAATATITKYFKFKVDENGVSKPEGTDGWTLTNKLDESTPPLP